MDLHRVNHGTLSPKNGPSPQRNQSQNVTLIPRHSLQVVKDTGHSVHGQHSETGIRISTNPQIGGKQFPCYPSADDSSLEFTTSAH